MRRMPRPLGIPSDSEIARWLIDCVCRESRVLNMFDYSRGTLLALQMNPNPRNAGLSWAASDARSAYSLSYNSLPPYLLTRPSLHRAFQSCLCKLTSLFLFTIPSAMQMTLTSPAQMQITNSLHHPPLPTLACENSRCHRRPASAFLCDFPDSAVYCFERHFLQL